MNKNFKCQRCHTTFTRKNSLKRHIKLYSQPNRTCGSSGFSLVGNLPHQIFISNNDTLPVASSYVSNSARVVKLIPRRMTHATNKTCNADSAETNTFDDIPAVGMLSTSSYFIFPF